MTKHFIKADPIAWKQQIAKLRTAKAACSRLKFPRDRDIQDQKWERYYETESALLAMPAPDIESVIAKLMLIWAEDIPSGAPEAEFKRKVIGDLRRIKMQDNFK